MTFVVFFILFHSLIISLILFSDVKKSITASSFNDQVIRFWNQASEIEMHDRIRHMVLVTDQAG